MVGKQLKLSSLNGIILTGGNDLVKYKGNAPERDETEHFLITRNLLPAVTTLSVIYANIKLNYIESSMNGKHLDLLK